MCQLVLGAQPALQDDQSSKAQTKLHTELLIRELIQSERTAFIVAVVIP